MKERKRGWRTISTFPAPGVPRRKRVERNIFPLPFHGLTIRGIIVFMPAFLVGHLGQILSLPYFLRKISQTMLSAESMIFVRL